MRAPAPDCGTVAIASPERYLGRRCLIWRAGIRPPWSSESRRQLKTSLAIGRRRVVLPIRLDILRP